MLPSSRSLSPLRASRASAAMPRSLKCAPMRSQSISSSDLRMRSHGYSALRSTRSNASATARSLAYASGPITPTRLAPRLLSSSIALRVARCSPQRTSASRAMRRARGKWLYHSMNMSSRSPGAKRTIASVVIGQPVSHCTPVPARFSPHTSNWSQPCVAMTSASALRRRANSASEKRGYSWSTIAWSRASSVNGPALVGMRVCIGRAHSLPETTRACELAGPWVESEAVSTGGGLDASAPRRDQTSAESQEEQTQHARLGHEEGADLASWEHSGVDVEVSPPVQHARDQSVLGLCYPPARRDKRRVVRRSHGQIEGGVKRSHGHPKREAGEARCRGGDARRSGEGRGGAAMNVRGRRVGKQAGKRGLYTHHVGDVIDGDCGSPSPRRHRPLGGTAQCPAKREDGSVTCWRREQQCCRQPQDLRCAPHRSASLLEF